MKKLSRSYYHQRIMKNQTELKPCPFCNVDQPEIKTTPSSNFISIRCRGCWAQGPHSVNEEFAIEWWNRRWQQPPEKRHFTGYK